MSMVLSLWIALSFTHFLKLKCIGYIQFTQKQNALPNRIHRPASIFVYLPFISLFLFRIHRFNLILLSLLTRIHANPFKASSTPALMLSASSINKCNLAKVHSCNLKRERGHQLDGPKVQNRNYRSGD